jgi:hypothetical protein
MKLPNLKLNGKQLLGLSLVVLFLTLTTGIVAAQEMKRSITLAYPALVHKLNPGDRAEGITRIINQSSVPLTFQIAVRDYVVLDTVGTPTILPPNTLSNKYSAAAWIGVTPQTFTLQPGEKQTINYYLQVPGNARPGGHYAAIVYTPVVGKGVTGSGSTVNSELGSLFYITINGPIHEQASVSKFFANPFQEYGPVDVLTQIKNFGDLHISPQGTITVTGLFFNQTQKLPTHNIFPEAARDFQNTFGQALMLGQYKAVLLASYGSNNNLPLMATVYFWVFPWKVTLIIVLAVVAIILAALYLRKRKIDGSGKPTEAQAEPVKEKEEATEAAEKKTTK